MSFDLHVDTDNDAFGSRPLAEVARILHNVADRIHRQGGEVPLEGPIHDLNGAGVGHWRYVRDDEGDDR